MIRILRIQHTHTTARVLFSTSLIAIIIAIQKKQREVGTHRGVRALAMKGVRRVVEAGDIAKFGKQDILVRMSGAE